MTANFTFYSFMMITVIFSCSHDAPDVTSRYLNRDPLASKLTKCNWKQVVKFNDAFTRKATVTFNQDGHFSKTDQYDYLGIKESVVETGTWSFDERSREIAIENPKTKLTSTYSIGKETENSIHLISIDGLEDLILSIL
ncbi:MAG: copper resistance protein NlpE [Bacteroidetes bacterium]|nr:copper resistance protein NlpE [Bacteroidota bacterium]